MRLHRVVVACTSTFVLLARAPSAGAQDTADIALRRSLLDQAQAAVRANDPARALDLAQRAGQIQMTPSLRAFLSEQHLALHHAVDALGMAELCVRDVDRDLALPNRVAIRATCARVAETARSQVGFVRVIAPEGLPAGFTLTIAGRPSSRNALGIPAPVDPGDVSVEATLGDARRDGRTVHVATGQVVDVPLFAQGIPSAPAPPRPAEVPATPGPTPAPASPTEFALVVEPSVVTADVVVDGQFSGTGRITRNVPPGVHRVEVRASGYVSWRNEVRVDTARTLSVVMERAPTQSPSRPAWVVPVAVVSTLVGAGAIAGVSTYLVLGNNAVTYGGQSGATWLGNTTEAAH